MRNVKAPIAKVTPIKAEVKAAKPAPKAKAPKAKIAKEAPAPVVAAAPVPSDSFIMSEDELQMLLSCQQTMQNVREQYVGLLMQSDLTIQILRTKFLEADAALNACMGKIAAAHGHDASMAWSLDTTTREVKPIKS